MNKPITRLAVTAVVLLSTLIVATTYWQVWASTGLRDRQDNALQRVAEFTIDRGEIFANDGRVPIATNVERKSAGKTFYYRTYPPAPPLRARRRLLDARPRPGRASSSR